jgi:hypothetical protein
VGVAEATLRTIRGVSVITTDPGTGSVLIVYDPTPSTREDAHGEDGVVGGLPVVWEPRRPASHLARFAVWVGRTAALVAIEIALQRALGPLFARPRC